MNTLLATFITGLVTDENQDFYFVQKDGQTFALSKEEGDFQLGQAVTGFAYSDMKQRLRLTTKPVSATQTDFGWGTVTEVRKDLGVFLDTGLPDKEVVVSLDILPELKELWPKKGDQLYVRYHVDKKDRIWASPAFPEDFQKLAGPAYDNMQTIICWASFILVSAMRSRVWARKLRPVSLATERWTEPSTFL